MPTKSTISDEKLHTAESQYIQSQGDQIDEHARQAWAVSELLIAHYGEGDFSMSSEVMSCLLENISSHLQEIRTIARGPSH